MLIIERSSRLHPGRISRLMSCTGLPASVQVIPNDRQSIKQDIRQAACEGRSIYFVDNMRLASMTIVMFPSARVVLDVGDDPTSLAQTTGASRLTVASMKTLQILLEHRADGIVVRGLGHAGAMAARRYAARTCIVPDAVALSHTFAPKPRPALGLCVGFVGHTTVTARARPAGWEIPELLSVLPTAFTALMVVAGDGVAWIRRRLGELRVGGRCTIIEGCSPDHLPTALGPADVFVSTQTANLAGHVRTTGKLVEYLAIGRPTIASRVGTASAILPPSLTVAIENVYSSDYISSVADRILRLRDIPDEEFDDLQRFCRTTAERLFDSRELGPLWLETMRRWNHLAAS